MCNLDIRTEAKKAGVYLWQIADYLKIADFTFSRQLRHELPQQEKDRIFEIIKTLEREAV